MKKLASALAALMISGSLFAGEPAQTTVTAREAFEKIKTLSGSWEGHIMKKDGDTAPVSYALTSSGTVVEEKLFAGASHEMTSMYHFEGEDLLYTHYCSGGSRPTMKFSAARSTPQQLVFEFVSVGGSWKKDTGHISDLKLRFIDDKHVEGEWKSRGGSHDAVPMIFYLDKK